MKVNEKYKGKIKNKYKQMIIITLLCYYRAFNVENNKNNAY